MRDTRPTTRPLRERGESAMRARERRARMRALARRWAARRLVARESRRSCEATRRTLPPAGAARGGARGALDDAELRHERGAAVAGARVAGDDAEADLAIRGHEDVGAVAGRVHPGGHDRLRAGELAGAPGEVLADPPGAAVRQVAGGADALGGLGAVAALVGEVAVGDHVVAVAEGGALQLAVDLQRGQAAVGALGVEEAQRGHRDRRRGCCRRAAWSALAHWSAAPTPSRALGAGRRTRGSIGRALESSRSRSLSESVIAPPRRPSVTPMLIAPGFDGAPRSVRARGVARGSAAGKPEGGQQHRNETRSASYPLYRSTATET